MNRFLCICPYVDRPTEGFRKMREILPKVSLHDMREVATAVGYSRNEEALEFLRDLGFGSDAATRHRKCVGRRSCRHR